MSFQMSFGVVTRLISCMAMTLLIGSMSHALEQQPLKPGRDIPAELKSMPMAGSVCRRSDENSVPKDVGNYHDAAADLSCGMAVPEAALLMEKSTTKLIDLRTANDYLLSHVPGAMNLALTDVVAKSYLRDSVVLLMGDGKHEIESYGACARLRQEGFRKVFVVRGGVLGWVQHGYPVQGDYLKSTDAFKITSEDLWAASQFSENKIFLDVGRVSMGALLPGVVALDKGDALEALRSAAKRKNGGKRAEALMGVILVASPNITEERIRGLLRAALPAPLLIYAGTDAEYRSFVGQQKALISAHARGPKKLGCGL